MATRIDILLTVGLDPWSHFPSFLTIPSLHLLLIPLLCVLIPPCGSCACPDELYAQKLKYKAISEELDHALNDMTSM